MHEVGAALQALDGVWPLQRAAGSLAWECRDCSSLHKFDVAERLSRQIFISVFFQFFFHFRNFKKIKKIKKLKIKNTILTSGTRRTSLKRPSPCPESHLVALTSLPCKAFCKGSMMWITKASYMRIMQQFVPFSFLCII